MPPLTFSSLKLRDARFRCNLRIRRHRDMQPMYNECTGYRGLVGSGATHAQRSGALFSLAERTQRDMVNHQLHESEIQKSASTSSEEPWYF